MGILAFLILVLAIPLTVQIAQKQQELRQHAAGTTQCQQNGGTCTGNTCYKPKVQCLYTKYGDTFGNCSRGGGLSCPDDPNNPEGPQASYSCVESAPDSCAEQVTGGFPPAECNIAGGECVNQACGGTPLGKCNDGRNCCPVSTGGGGTTDTCTAKGFSCGLDTCAGVNGANQLREDLTCANGHPCCDLSAGTTGGGNCGNKNCSSNETCIGSSNNNSLGTFCLTKGAGDSDKSDGLTAYCGTPNGAPNNDACSSGVCGSDLRCQPSTGNQTPAQICQSQYSGSCQPEGICAKPAAGAPALCGRDEVCCQQVKSGTGTSCNINDQNDNWQYLCGAQGGCQPGFHKAVCKVNASQNTDTCWPDTSFVGTNPCASAPGGTPASPGSSPSSQQGFPLPGCDPQKVTCASGETAVRGTGPDSFFCRVNATGQVANDAPSCSTSTSQVDCTVPNEALSTACQVAQNTCSNSSTGTRTIVKDSGSAGCRSVTLPRQPCKTPETVINNCNSGSVCPAGGTGACIVQNSSQNGNTQLAFVLGLHGIGSFGDSKNANSSGSNKNPRRTTRSLGVELFDSNNTSNKLFSITGNLVYDSTSGTFSSTVTLPNTFQTGNYLVKIKPDGYLRATVKGSGGADTNFQTGNTSGVWNIIAGKKNTLGLTSVIVVTGDILGTNHLIDSYDRLRNCIFKAATGDCQASDLNDDGQVDQFDYNLFLREIAVVQNGD